MIYNRKKDAGSLRKALASLMVAPIALLCGGCDEAVTDAATDNAVPPEYGVLVVVDADGAFVTQQLQIPRPEGYAGPAIARLIRTDGELIEEHEAPTMQALRQKLLPGISELSERLFSANPEEFARIVSEEVMGDSPEMLRTMVEGPLGEMLSAGTIETIERILSASDEERAGLIGEVVR